MRRDWERLWPTAAAAGLIAMTGGSLGCRTPSSEREVLEAGVADAAARLLLVSAPPPAPPDPHAPAPVPKVSQPTRRRLPPEADELTRYRASLERQFGAEAELAMEQIPLSGERRSLLFRDTGEEQQPLILTVDPEGAVEWTKELPLAGMVDGVKLVSIVPGPMGGVAIFLFAEQNHAVGARMWDGDGVIFADYHLLDVESATALAALRLSGAGWVAVAENDDGARMQWLREDGRLATSRDGFVVGTNALTRAELRLARDADDSVMVVQVGPAKNAVGARDRVHVFVSRVSFDGAPKWPRPLEVGVVAREGGGAVDTDVSARDDGVAIAVSAGASPPLSVVVRSDGTLTRDAR